MTYTIRPFTDADYTAIAEISNEAYENHETAESLRDQISRIDPKYRFSGWVAECDGQVVAIGTSQHMIGQYHPRKFELSVAVRKAFRGRGIGTALYNHLRQTLAEYDPISLESGAKESWPDSLRFLKRLGFVEAMTFWESQLDLQAWDPAAFAAVVDQAQAAGYRFATMADLEAADPDYLRRIHALVQEVKVDVPTTETHTEIPFDEWQKLILTPQLRKELYFIAFHGSELVGLSTLWGSNEPDMMETGLTAVKRAHRRHGVARALKVVALSAAKAIGHSRVKTFNESNNRAMLGINIWLGFERKPGWVAHKLQLQPETDRFRVRPFDAQTDYPGLAEVAGTVYENRVTAESIIDDDSRRDPKCRYQYIVAEADGRVVGFGELSQWPGAYHPRKFSVSVGVLPEYRRQGIGTALYQALREALAETDPISLEAGTKESWPEAMRFLERRGFVEQMRNWESNLDLTRFDPAPFADAAAEAEARGYQLVPLSEWPETPERNQLIYAFSSVARLDIPTATPLTPVPFEQWVKNLTRPTFRPTLYWVALKDGQVVGMSNHWATDDEGVLETGFTGVLREHRGAGLAKALKVRALAAAKAEGYKLVKTWNATTNAPMLAVNIWLGFERRPAWVVYQVQLHTEE